LRVRGSPHPLFYDADLSLTTSESNALRIQPDLSSGEQRITGIHPDSTTQTFPSSNPLHSTFSPLTFSKTEGKDGKDETMTRRLKTNQRCQTDPRSAIFPA